MRYLLIFLVFQTYWANADQAKDPCDPVLFNASPEVSKEFAIDLDDIYEEIRREHSITDEMIGTAPCRKPVPSDTEMLAEIDLLAIPGDISQEIGGVNFKDESPTLLQSFQYLTTLNPQLFSRDEPKQLDVQRRYKVNPSCNKVLCAVKKIFGEELGPKLLYMNVKYGVNGSHIAYHNSSKLRIDEVDRMIRGLSDYPEGTFPLKENKQMIKFQRGATLGGEEGTLANAVMMFFDRWNEENDIQREYTVTHELAHYIAGEKNLDEDPRWLKLGGWVEKNGRWSSTKDNSITLYGDTNPSEDFAESVSAYRYAGAKLKEENPDKYDFIKETVFGGVEYLSPKTCLKGRDSNLAAIKEGLEKALANIDTSSIVSNQEEQKKILQKCINASMQFVFKNDDQSIDELNKCLQKATVREQALMYLKSLEPPLAIPELTYEKLLPEIDSIIETNVKTIKESNLLMRQRIKDDFVSDVQNNDYLSSFKFKKETDPKKLCHQVSENGDIYFKSVRDTYTYSNLLQLSNHDENITRLIYDTCFNARKNQEGNFDTLTIEQVKRNIKISVYKKEDRAAFQEEAEKLRRQLKELTDRHNEHNFIMQKYHQSESESEYSKIDTKLAVLEEKIGGR